MTNKLNIMLNAVNLFILMASILIFGLTFMISQTFDLQITDTQATIDLQIARFNQSILFTRLVTAVIVILCFAMAILLNKSKNPKS